MLDSLPVGGVLVVLAVAMLLCFEAGYRIGRWWQGKTPDEKEGPTGMIVGSLLALMAFLLAITMGMASDRYNARRGLVLDEANAIGTVYLRAGYLPQPVSDDTRTLLREYIPLRIVSSDDGSLDVRLARSAEISNSLWSMAEDQARANPDSVVLGLYIDALNHMFDVSESRVTAGVYARVPSTVLLLLVIGACLALAMVGYNAGLTRRRSLLTAVVLVIALSAVITLVIDLDRPQGGTLRVSQQPLLDLVQQTQP